MPPKRKKNAKVVAPDACFADLSFETIQGCLDYAEPDLASIEITESFDMNTLCLLMCFMLGWHPMDRAPQGSEEDLKKAAHFEYIRRGRPLRKTWWNIKMVSSFMAVHMENKTEGEDLGAWGSWFSRGYEDKPAPMPAFIMQKAKSMNIPMAETEDEITIEREEVENPNAWPVMNFLVESIEDISSTEFPKSGYELFVQGDGEIHIEHPEIPDEVAIVFIQEKENDDWQIYPTRDGDTLWNSTAHFEPATKPRYVQGIFQALSILAIQKEEETEKNILAQKKRAASTSPPKSEKRVRVPVDRDDRDVSIKDRVFLHTDGDGKWFVVRPFDLRQALLPYKDPILSICHYVGKSEEKNVYVIDSHSKDPSTKPAYAHRLLKKSGMPARRASLEKCNTLRKEWGLL